MPIRNVKPSEYPSNPGTAKLTAIYKMLILELVIQRPGIFLREIKGHLLEQTGTDVNVSTIMRYLHTSGLARQKMIPRA